MYDRASRIGECIVGNPLPNIGPGTYDVPRLSDKWMKLDSYAPFQSMSDREHWFQCNDVLQAAPGPGSYDPKFAQYKTPGGGSLANKGSRFERENETIKIVPGPGMYNVSKKSDWIKTKQLSSTNNAIPATGQNKNSGGNLLTNRVKYQRQVDAPSIPTPGQAFGYEETQNGVLKKQVPPDKDCTIGPAFYNNMETVETVAVKKYKGVHFGKLTGGRTDFSKDSWVPGPGQYDPHVKSIDERMMFVNLEGKKQDTTLPRYHEIIEKTELKKSIPGPGRYNIDGQFIRKTPVINIQGLEVEHPPFNVKSSRFGDVKYKAPPVGSYNDPRNAMESLSRVTGMKKSPFGQTAVRFHPHNKKFTPGPGQYNIYNMGLANDSMKKAYMESTRQGAFGSTATRIHPVVKKDQPYMPGPSHYQPRKREESYKKHHTGNFTSTSNRIAHVATETQQSNPPPGSYDVASSYVKTYSKKSAAAPRTKEAYLRNASFVSAAKRATSITAVPMEDETPGPGAYDQSFIGKHVKLSLFVGKDKRFREFKDDDKPGPGAYHLSPLIASTVLKGTFNATLNNPVLKNFDESTSAKTPQQALLVGI